MELSQIFSQALLLQPLARLLVAFSIVFRGRPAYLIDLFWVIVLKQRVVGLELWFQRHRGMP